MAAFQPAAHSSARPSTGVKTSTPAAAKAPVKTNSASSVATGSSGFTPQPTTHSVMDETGRNYVNSVRMWENPSEYQDTFIKLQVTEALPAGRYRVSSKKDHPSDFIGLEQGYNIKINKEYFNGIKITVEEGKFGLVALFDVEDTLLPGNYYITKRRAKH